MITLTPEQDRALCAVRDWLASGDAPVFRLFGYAGTGKTTLMRHLGVPRTLFAAYTGKAAYVLREKGVPAQTIHKLIYHPKEKSKLRLLHLMELLEKDPENEELQRQVREEEQNVARPAWSINQESELRAAQLLVIDECSMVNASMAEDLLSFGVPILALGDPAQLPPVRGGGYFTDATPDFMLQEIHRQARENPILDLATTVRETGRMPREHPCIVPAPTPELAAAVDQLIVGTNDTRRRANRRLRELLGYRPEENHLPIVGEKVVCLRNNHTEGLVNGALHTVTRSTDGLVLELELDGELVVEVHREPFLGKSLDAWRVQEAEMFDYGYALTCHKAQGSQWNRVGVIDESEKFRANRRRWLYTAITRAAKELWIA